MSTLHSHFWKFFIATQDMSMPQGGRESSMSTLHSHLWKSSSPPKDMSMHQGGRESSTSTLHSHLWKFFITTQRDVNTSRRQGIKHVYTTLPLVEVFHHHPKRSQYLKEAGDQACLHYTPTCGSLHHHPKRCEHFKEAGNQACLHYTLTCGSSSSPPREMSLPQGGRGSSMSTLHSHLWKFFITTQRDVNTSRRCREYSTSPSCETFRH